MPQNQENQEARRRMRSEESGTYTADVLRNFVHNLERGWSTQTAEESRNGFSAELRMCARRRDFPEDSHDDYFYYASGRWAMAELVALSELSRGEF